MNASTFLDKVKKNALNHSDYLYTKSDYSPYAESLESLLTIGEDLKDIETDGVFYISNDFAVNTENKKMYLVTSKDFEIAVAKYNYGCDKTYLCLMIITKYFIYFLMSIAGFVILSQISLDILHMFVAYFE